MSTTTPNLGLFKYDPSTDGAQTFNIKKALNENWDKVDESVLLALAAAAPYSTSQTYVVGSYCTRDGKLYRCTTAITTAETWTEDHWTETTMADELIDIYTALSNKAPGGYGLGGSAKFLTPDDDIDNICAAGWYAWDIAPTNAPLNYASMIVLNKGGYYSTHQIIIGIDGTMVKRNSENYIWGNVEYFNPPMTIGVEYRTTERYMEKPVYAKAIDCGAAPSNSTKYVSTGVSGMQYIVSLFGYRNDGSTLPFEDADGYYIKLCNISGKGIALKSNHDFSSKTCTVIVKYTKTTD